MEEVYKAVETAINISVEAHSGQKDETGHPYILHPLRVMSRFNNPYKQIVAVLHDVIEDTEVTEETLRDFGIPELAIEAIDLLTRKISNNSMGQTYDEYIQRILDWPREDTEARDIAIAVKLADLEDNMSPWRNYDTIASYDKKGLKRVARYRKAWNKLKGLVSQKEITKASL